LASHFEGHINKFINRTGVMFTNYHGNNQPISHYNPDLSRIARYVRSIKPNLFYRVGPDTTRIDRDLIRNIRDLHMNVPVNFA
jgi:hypothetical protein